MWTKTTSPLDGQAINAACWSPDLAEFLIGSGSGFHVEDQQSLMLAGSPDGITWTYRPTIIDADYLDPSLIPFNWAGAGVRGISRATATGMYVAIGDIMDSGSFFSGFFCTVAYMWSYDGTTWHVDWAEANSQYANPWIDPLISGANGSGNCIACKQASGLMIAGGTQPFFTHLHSDIPALQAATGSVSGDRLSWTGITSPFDSTTSSSNSVASIDYSPSEDVWVALGFVDGFGSATAYSGDDGATWSALHSVPAGFGPTRVRRAEHLGKWFLMGALSGYKLYESIDHGVTWSYITPPTPGVFDLLDIDGILLGTAGYTRSSSPNPEMGVTIDGGVTWLLDETPEPFTGGGVVGTAMAYSPSLDRAIAVSKGGAQSGVAYGLPHPSTGLHIWHTF